MPWKRESPMDQKIQLISDWLSEEYGKSQLSRRYDVSRPTVDKWISRYEAHGAEGLQDRSRAPRTVANKTSVDITDKLIAEKLLHEDWGPKKLVKRLQEKDPQTHWPAVSTAGDLLKRAGLVKPRKRRLQTPVNSQPLAHCQAPNQVWSVDYKGHFSTGDGRRCYPLTLSDNDSRYLLLCQALKQPRYQETRGWLEWAFRSYGLPDAIRSDNGTPFASTALGGLSVLSVWWIRLGIEPERIQPGRPDQNGRHERMHRSLKAGACNPPKATLLKQQEAFNHFCKEFNEERPHEALDMDTPDSRYHESERAYPAKLPELEYGDDQEVRRVRSNGEIKWRGQLTFTSTALIGEWIGLKENKQQQWDLYFSTHHIGVLNQKKNRFEPPKV
jgi:transposase InsO family protein